MHKSQFRNPRNMGMRVQGNMSPPKVQNAVAVESKDSEVDDVQRIEMVDDENAQIYKKSVKKQQDRLKANASEWLNEN